MTKTLLDLQVEADKRNARLLGDEGNTDRFWFVRDGELVMLPMEATTEEENEHLFRVFDQAIMRHVEIRDSAQRFRDFLQPYIREGEKKVTVSEVCKRAGLTIEQAWELAQAKGEPL